PLGGHARRGEVQQDAAVLLLDSRLVSDRPRGLIELTDQGTRCRPLSDRLAGGDAALRLLSWRRGRSGGWPACVSVDQYTGRQLYMNVVAGRRLDGRCDGPGGLDW